MAGKEPILQNGSGQRLLESPMNKQSSSVPVQVLLDVGWDKTVLVVNETQKSILASGMSTISEMGPERRGRRGLLRKKGPGPKSLARHDDYQVGAGRVYDPWTFWTFSTCPCDLRRSSYYRLLIRIHWLVMVFLL